MTDAGEWPPGATAGAMLRAAREKQGLHIAALAAAIKVTPRKLEALEHDRYEELPDATFTRALAQTVCRSLKIDPAPVLARLPHAETPTLDHVTGRLNTPFRERPGREDPGGLAAAAIRPMVWAGMALLLATAAIYLVPHDWWMQRLAAAEPVVLKPAAPALVASAPEPMPALEPAPSASEPMVLASAPAAAGLATPVPAQQPVAVAAVPPSAATAVATTAALASAPLAGKLVQLHSDKASWCEARDASGSVLLSRIVQAGETVALDGALPIKLTIGNAAATQLSVRGKPVELAASTRDNVARLEVQ